MVLLCFEKFERHSGVGCAIANQIKFWCSVKIARTSSAVSNTIPFWILFTHLYSVCLPSHSAVLEGSLPTRHQSHLPRAPDAKKNQVMRVNLSSHVKTLIISIWKNSFATLALESHVVSSAHICTLCLSKLCGGLNPLELW